MVSINLIFRVMRNAEIIDELLKQSASEDGDADYSEDSDEDEASERSLDPKWILYWTVRNYAHPHNPGTTLAEFFCQLPSRKSVLLLSKVHQFIYYTSVLPLTFEALLIKSAVV
jgi:hypothetical protein